MSDYTSTFKIPRNIDRYLAALSKIYSQNDNKDQQRIIVNSQVRIYEECSYDNLNGDIGHAVYLIVPESIYPKSIEQKGELERQIKEDLNNINTFKNEFIDEVFIEIEVQGNYDWRKESGLLLHTKYIISPDTGKRIWGGEDFRVFLSHKNEFKGKAVELKERLKIFGISCFVAHDDIEPSRAWQEEIENALFSMDALVALLTAEFHDSFWTDQEIGVAFGRGVPIIAVKLGRDPYGFIGKFQALSCSWEKTAPNIVKILINNDRMLATYLKAVKDCQRFSDANMLSEILPSINRLSNEQVINLLSAFNENNQLKYSYGFSGKSSYGYENGLDYHLSRLTGEKYRLTDSGNIEVEI